MDYESALASDGDGLDAKYLVDITYTPSYSLPADKTNGYWYAVCVYDGYGFESQPALANYAESGIVEISDDSAIQMTVIGNEVSFDRPARQVVVYNVSGVEILSASSVQTLTLPGRGVYIINADGTPMSVYVR